jgi:hypothetical protein
MMNQPDDSAIKLITMERRAAEKRAGNTHPGLSGMIKPLKLLKN